MINFSTCLAVMLSAQLISKYGIEVSPVPSWQLVNDQSSHTVRVHTTASWLCLRQEVSESNLLH